MKYRKSRFVCNQNLKISNNKEDGVTLVALVITIIVLLILAGVAIATLTGENGILNQAEKSGEQAEIGEIKEKARLDIANWVADKASKSEETTLNDNVVKSILTGKEYVEEVKDTSFISKNGHEILYADLYDRLSTVNEEKEKETVFAQNTTLEDSYGNTVKIPEGFKIASDSAIDVTGGIVIEDVSHSATIGSQFVWIPVGKIYTNAEQTTYETIELSRYVFNFNTGYKTNVGEKAINLRNYDYLELTSSSILNKGAKDIEKFRTTTINSKGYYIGRYEARTITQRADKDDEIEQITVKPNDYVYNYITQLQAATLSQEMYIGKTFTSDLVNSYAWDTTVVFMQTFDNRLEKTKPYSVQNSSNIEFAIKGTNNTDTMDKICNIWDMASNCYEWITENCSNPNYPCVVRGGDYLYEDSYTSIRDDGSVDDSYQNISFRPILYL